MNIVVVYFPAALPIVFIWTKTMRRLARCSTTLCSKPPTCLRLSVKYVRCQWLQAGCYRSGPVLCLVFVSMICVGPYFPIQCHSPCFAQMEVASSTNSGLVGQALRELQLDGSQSPTASLAASSKWTFDRDSFHSASAPSAADAHADELDLSHLPASLLEMLPKLYNQKALPPGVVQVRSKRFEGC